MFPITSAKGLIPKASSAILVAFLSESSRTLRRAEAPAPPCMDLIRPLSISKMTSSLSFPIPPLMEASIIALPLTVPSTGEMMDSPAGRFARIPGSSISPVSAPPTLDQPPRSQLISVPRFVVRERHTPPDKSSLIRFATNTIS